MSQSIEETSNGNGAPPRLDAAAWSSQTGSATLSTPPPAPQPQPAPPQAPLWGWGFNRPLTPEEFRRACLGPEQINILRRGPLSPQDAARAALGRVQQLAKRDGTQVPEDLADFADIADVVCLDENSQPVDFDSVDLVFLKNGRPVKFTRIVTAWER